MREEINRLTNLQVLDQRLRAQEQELSKVTARVDELRGHLETYQAELARLQQEEQQAELARRELERNLAEGEVQIRNKRMRLSLIKNERELQALGHEVEALKEGNQRLEADLLARMEGHDSHAARIKELTELVEQEGAELKDAEQAVAGQIETLTNDIARQRKERDQIAAQIDSALCQRYEMIFERRGGLAVVAVKSGTCYGCRMRIPPQLFNQILKLEAIHFCPNCQRILFNEPDKEHAA